MNVYEASNYSMGRKVKTVRILAGSDEQAMREAERLMPGANALPGTVRESASRARVIGVRAAK